MAYFNFEIAAKKGLSETEMFTLQIIKQLKSEPEREVNLVNILTDSFLEKAEQKGWITQIKGKKGDSEISKIRLTKSGNKLLRDLTTYGAPDEDSKVLAEWLIEIYSKRIVSVKSNKKELERRLHFFATETEIKQNRLASLLGMFINDTYVEDVSDKRPFNLKFNEFKAENPRAVLSQKAENVLWVPKDRYAKEMTLEDSPLWAYYQENEAFVEEYWKVQGL